MKASRRLGWSDRAARFASCTLPSAVAYYRHTRGMFAGSQGPSNRLWVNRGTHNEDMQVIGPDDVCDSLNHSFATIGP